MKSSTLLFRSSGRPSDLHIDCEITSHVFRPTPEPHGRLSAYEGNLITTEQSWEHYTIHLKRRSVGVKRTADFRSGATAYLKRDAEKANES